MNDLCLKFADEAEAIKVLSAYRGVDENGQSFWMQASHTHCLDVIGILYTDAIYDGETVITPPQKIEGFHINLKCEDSTEYTKYIVNPTNRKRVWA